MVQAGSTFGGQNMRQFQFPYENEDKLVNSLRKIKQWCNSSVTSGTFFQIYSTTLNRSKVETVCALIEREMPDAKYIGCSTNGNVFIGDYTDAEITICCTVFEYFTTNLKVFQYPLNSENEKEVTTDLVERVKECPWCKCVIANVTIRGMSMTDFCEDLSALPEGVQFFGGGALSADINSDYAIVFSSAGAISDHSVVFALIGGEDFNVRSNYIAGWKPLGRTLKVTRAKGTVLYELDGRPAYETYYKYLNIKNDENFFNNTLEFPFFYEHNGINILRAPISSQPDGSLVMTADIAQNVNARIAYGDPWTILSNVNEETLRIKEFIPEAIMVFSCAARKAFWGDKEVGKETLPLQSIASTSGFYTSGEFLRTGDKVNQHNVTLVIAAMREGKRNVDNMPNADLHSEEFSGKVSMINRLATFIQAATEELEEANERLRLAAIMDGLTQVYNRREIQRLITQSVEEGRKSCLLMMDLDDFKKVNDTYGHKEGDEVLKKLTSVLKDTCSKTVPESYVGRWGGEEFMVLLPETELKKASALAELIRVGFSVVDYTNAPNQTITIGVTEFKQGEDPDTYCMRVDSALYTGKANGKNQVVVR